MGVLAPIDVVQNMIMMMIATVVLDEPVEFDYFSASSLRQQSTGRHLALIVHTILITWEPVFALTPWA